MDSGRSTRALPRVSFLIRRSRDQRSVSTSPGLIAAAHVLHRLLAPRHPPCALVLLIRKEHVRCRYGVFKVRASSSSTPCGRCRSIRTSRCRPTCACPRSFKAQQRAAGPEGTARLRGRRCSRRTLSPDESRQWAGVIRTGRAASGVRAPDSLERR
jgi:hypothetical protein